MIIEIEVVKDEPFIPFKYCECWAVFPPDGEYPESHDHWVYSGPWQSALADAIDKYGRSEIDEVRLTK